LFSKIQTLFIQQNAETTTLHRIFWVYAALVLACVSGALYLEQPLLVVIPFGLLVVFQTFIDYKKIFYLLLATLPVSMEIHFSASLGTDLPAEPLMVGLMLVYITDIFSRPHNRWSLQVFRHPIILLLLLHFVWAGASTILSESQGISIKWMLAKAWYLVTFVLVAIECLREEDDLKWFYYTFTPVLLLTIVWTHLRQLSMDFEIETVNDALKPFYRNHVNYASHVALALPFLWFARQWFPKTTTGFLLYCTPVVLGIGAIALSFTRAAFVALLLGVVMYWVFRFKMIKLVLVIASVIATIGIGYLVYDNNYLKLAPEYETTVSHHEFGDIVAATAAGKDVSTMERVNRWVAGGRMIADHPVLGFGPNTFFSFYKKYSLASFRTYVSVNDEKSTVHCYYLLTFIEQGFVGFLIFMALIYGVLIQGQRIYHETTNATRKNIVMASLLSFVIILAFLLINDMVETDKVGAFFFLNMAILVNMDMKNRYENSPV
jgi:O-antigen ligase